MGVMVSANDVLQALLDVGAISATIVQEKVRPSHGACCTCQECGRDYDTCVCSSNEIVAAIQKLVAREAE